MSNLTEEKIELLERYQEELLKQRHRVLLEFIPGIPEAVPFDRQVAFLKDTNLSKIARCGNRAAKTFTMMRDLAWKITRTHWYRQDYNVFSLAYRKWKDKLADGPLYEELYLETKPQTFWIVGPTYDFVNNTMWGMYLSKMIPKWFIKDIKYTNQKNIDTIFFINGDTIKCKTYSQQDTTKMGFVVNGVYVDEMPPDVMTITELVVRTFDCDGQITLGFTSLVQNDDIRKYIDSSCEAGTMSLHQWTIRDNPLYRDHPERMARVLEEYKHLSETEREARLSGAWYYETPEKSVFEGIDPEIVEDFVIPMSWRRVRFTDPAAHITGHAEFAEDPADGTWYCYLGSEITWGKAAKAEDILEAINNFKPAASYRYLRSVYDNAEAWFGAYGARFGYTPCILKNREAAIMLTRQAIGSGKVKFFKHGAQKAYKQLVDYKFHKNGGGEVVKRNDHVLDCVMYFCREIPDPLVSEKDMLTPAQTAIARVKEKFEEEKDSVKVTSMASARALWVKHHPVTKLNRQRRPR